MTREERSKKLSYLLSRFKSTPPKKSRKATVRFENLIYNAADEQIENLYDLEKRKEEK